MANPNSPSVAALASSGQTDLRFLKQDADGTVTGFEYDALDDVLECASRPWNTLAGALAYGAAAGARAFHGRDRPASSATMTPEPAFAGCGGLPRDNGACLMANQASTR